MLEERSQSAVLDRDLQWSSAGRDQSSLSGVEHLSSLMDGSGASWAEDTLATRERCFRQVLDALPAAIYATDAEGRITYYNQAAVDLSGNRPVLGSDQWCVSWKLFWPDGTKLPHDECPMALCLKTGEPQRGYEAIAERPDGTRVPFIPFPTPLFDGSGALVGAVNMLVDITERKRAEDVLRERDASLERANRELEERVEVRTRELAEKTALLQATLDNMDQGIMMVDASGTVPVCNRRTSELLDLPLELMRSRPSFEAVRRHQIESNEFVNSDEGFRRWVETTGVEKTPHIYERERPNGIVLEVRSVPLPEGGVVRTYTDITARKQAERRVEHMARHDVLTDLPNRALLHQHLVQRLAEVKRHGGSVALLCLDLDRFKTVNDTLGHPAGDALLQQVATRMRIALPGEDTLARLGGDEFAILQVGVDQPTSAGALAQRLVELVGQPFRVGEQEVTIGLSIGIALAPNDGLDPDDLFKQADLALYRAKGEGRNTFRFYEAAMDEAVQARQQLELDLRGALARSEFELHYQPVLNVGRHEITGFEALVRWRHPTRGLVSPAEFIPVAEASSLIVPIGEWVLRKACEQAASCPHELRLAVNVSAVQFRQPGLVENVISALAASGLSPERLEIEITESVLIQDSDTVVRTLHQLRALGVRIALDDFGTGYSSLSYLQRFPFDKIKIDRSFIRKRCFQATALRAGVIG